MAPHKRNFGGFIGQVGHGISAGLPIRLHLRNDLHLARKLWHMSMGLAIVLAYLAGMERGTMVVALGSILGLDLILEMTRLRVPSVNEKIMRMWGPLMRTCEADRLSGIPYYLAATVLAIGIFPQPVAVLSILYLAFGDPLASLFGILYGKHGPRFKSGKSMIGTSAGVMTCAIATFIFLSASHVMSPEIWIFTAIGGLIGGTAELLPLEVDDNFSIPVVSGFVLWLAFIILGL